MPITWSNFRFHFKIIVSFLSWHFTIWCIKVCCKDTKNPFFLVMFLQISGRRWNCLSVSSACCNLWKGNHIKLVQCFSYKFTAGYNLSRFPSAEETLQIYDCSNFNRKFLMFPSDHNISYFFVSLTCQIHPQPREAPRSSL